MTKKPGISLKKGWCASALIFLFMIAAVPVNANPTEDFRELLVEEDEARELFLIDSGEFSFSGYTQRSPSEMVAYYDIEGADDRISVTLLHGEAARQDYSDQQCDLKEGDELEAGEATLYASFGMRSLTARTYLDDLALSFGYRFNGSVDEDEVKQQVADLAALLDLERLKNFDYPTIESPGNGLEMVALDADEFAEFFPEETGPLRLQDVVSYEDAMHVRADYLYEPEDHEISIHMAYGDFSERLQVRGQLPGLRVGNFEFAGEYRCLREEVGDDTFQEVAESLVLPQEAEITRWEMENIDMTGMNPLAGLFPVDFDDYSITSFDPDPEDLQVVAAYEHIGDGDPVTLSVRYGDDAARQYNRYQLASTQEERHRFETGGITYNAVEAGDDFLVFTYQDHLLIEAGIEEPANLEDINAQTGYISEFLSAFDTDGLLAWQAPDDYEMEFDGTLEDGAVHCLDPGCIDEHLAECEPAGFGGRLGRGLGIMYRIEEADGDQCRMSMTYITNRRNDELEDEPMYFYINRNGSFAEEGLDLVEQCLEGASDECHGPLLDLMEGE